MTQKAPTVIKKLLAIGLKGITYFPQLELQLKTVVEPASTLIQLHSQKH